MVAKIIGTSQFEKLPLGIIVTLKILVGLSRTLWSTFVLGLQDD